MAVTHTFVSALPDDAADAAAGLVVSSNWNDGHVIDGLLEGDGSVRLALKNTNVDNADNGDLRLSAAAYDANPISGRWNQVYRLGYNMGTLGTSYDAGEPSMGIQWESFYEQGGEELLEWHQSVFKTNNDEVRFESWSITRDDYSVSKLSLFKDWSLYNASATQLIKFDTAATAGSMVVDVNGGASVFRWRENAIPLLQQRNAADSAYLNLPYIDADNRIRMQSPGVITADMPSGGSFGSRFLVIQSTNPTHGSTVLSIDGGDPNGSLALVSASANCKWDAEIVLYNQYNAGGAAASFHAMVVAGGADAVVEFDVLGALTWCAGVDNSDSDSFVIAKNNVPGTNNALRIDASLNSRFYGNLGIANATNGQACEIKTLTELLTIAAAATSTTTIQKPANSIILAVPVRVTTAVTCTATFTVGDAGSATRFSTAAVSKAANTTDKGTAAGAYYNATAEGIVITPDTVPSDATGRVRVTIYYIELTPPTS